MSDTAPLPPELDETDKTLLNAAQAEFPLVGRPYRELGRLAGVGEDEALRRFAGYKARGILRQTSAIFDTRALGYKSTLVAMRFAPERLDLGAAVVSRHPGVSHNYKREHAYNLWFTIAVPREGNLKRVIDALHAEAGALDTIILPTLRLYKIGVNFDLKAAVDASKGGEVRADDRLGDFRSVTEADKAAVRVTQDDLPLEPEPFALWAGRLGLDEAGLFAWLAGMKERKLFRRFASILRHRAAGFADNAMAVWVVPEARCDELGFKMAAFKAVTHCYRRPVFESWPYNVFTMVHGRSKEDCEAVVEAIRAETGLAEYRLLYSTREYKKERVKYFTETPEQLMAAPAAV